MWLLSGDVNQYAYQEAAEGKEGYIEGVCAAPSLAAVGIGRKGPEPGSPRPERPCCGLLVMPVSGQMGRREQKGLAPAREMRCIGPMLALYQRGEVLPEDRQGAGYREVYATYCSAPEAASWLPARDGAKQ